MLLNTLKKTFSYASAIALGIFAVNFLSLSSNAQTNSSEDFMFKDIEARDDGGWSFSSEEETISIQNNLSELGKYNINESATDKEVQLIEEERRWGNKGDRPDYSIEAEIFDY